MSGLLFLNAPARSDRRPVLREKRAPLAALACLAAGFLCADHAQAQQPSAPHPKAPATASAVPPPPPPPPLPSASAVAEPPPPPPETGQPPPAPPPPPPSAGPGGYPPAPGASGSPPPGYAPYGPYYYPYPYYYGTPYPSTSSAPPPPPPPTKRNSPTLMGVGIAMTSLGIVGVLSGLAAFASANNRIDVYCDGGFLCGNRDDEDLQAAGGALMIVGGVLGAVGIPLWVIGGKRIPLKPTENSNTPSDKPPAAPQATLKIGPGSAGLHVAF